MKIELTLPLSLLPKHLPRGNITVKQINIKLKVRELFILINALLRQTTLLKFH